MMQQKTPDPAIRDQVCGDVIEDRVKKGPQTCIFSSSLQQGLAEAQKGGLCILQLRVWARDKDGELLSREEKG
jgi:hypothetical protein